MLKIQSILRAKADPKKATSLERFFKTAPGQYGHGDKFLGGFRTEVLRSLSKKYLLEEKKDLALLFKSPFHEERLVGVYMLVELYRSDPKEEYVRWYIDLKEGLNNWDLVDASTYFILGDYSLKSKDTSLIKSLAKSPRHWDKRMAMVSTLAFIRDNQLDLTYSLAKLFLKEKEDLMHKATGWMLREAGKKDLKRLEDFIFKHGKSMPRTMLRYAIEKFPEKQRKEILSKTKV